MHKLATAGSKPAAGEGSAGHPLMHLAQSALQVAGPSESLQASFHGNSNVVSPHAPHGREHVLQQEWNHAQRDLASSQQLMASWVAAQSHSGPQQHQAQHALPQHAVQPSFGGQPAFAGAVPMQQPMQHVPHAAIHPQASRFQPAAAGGSTSQSTAASPPAQAEAAPPSTPLDDAREQAARLAAALRTSGNPQQSPQLLSFMDSVANGSVSLPHLAQAAAIGGAAGAGESPAEAALRAADAELTATWTEALQSDDPSAVDGLMQGVLGKARTLQAAQVAVAAERAQQGGAHTSVGGVSVDPAGGDEFANLTEDARQRLMEAWAGAVDSETALDGEALGLDMDVAVGGEGGGAAAARSLDDIVPLEATQYTFTHGPGAGQAHGAFAALGEEEALAAGRAALAGGRPHDAVAAFESALARESGNADAWRELGEAHAELENDPAAIVCFKRAVAEDPFNTQALLALGVSLLNERQRQDALVVLQAWLEHNEQFAGHDLAALSAAEEVPAAATAAAGAASQGLAVEQPVDAAQQTRIMKMLLAAQRVAAEDEGIQTVMGVMHSIGRDFQAAAKCFQVAAEAHPDSHVAWSRWGACLANSGQHEQAEGKYLHALQLKPRFARCMFNLGATYFKLQRYEEAARMHLQALLTNPDAVHVCALI